MIVRYVYYLNVERAVVCHLQNIVSSLSDARTVEKQSTDERHLFKQKSPLDLKNWSFFRQMTSMMMNVLL